MEGVYFHPLSDNKAVMYYGQKDDLNSAMIRVSCRVLKKGEEIDPVFWNREKEVKVGGKRLAVKTDDFVKFSDLLGAKFPSKLKKYQTLFHKLNEKIGHFSEKEKGRILFEFANALLSPPGTETVIRASNRAELFVLTGDKKNRPVAAFTKEVEKRSILSDENITKGLMNLENGEDLIVKYAVQNPLKYKELPRDKETFFKILQDEQEFGKSL